MHELAPRPAERITGIFPWGAELLALLLDELATGHGQSEGATGVTLLLSDEAFVLELLEHRVDRAGARAPDIARALCDLLDELVAVA